MSQKCLLPPDLAQKVFVGEKENGAWVVEFRKTKDGGFKC